MTYDDFNDHPFSPASVAFESGDMPGDRAWLVWCRRAEKLLGVKTLDRDGRAGGYCLDGAYEAFEAGRSPAEYVAAVRS